MVLGIRARHKFTVSAIVHIGPDVSEPGGIETVIGTYLRLSQPWDVSAVATWSARRPRRLPPIRAMVELIRIAVVGSGAIHVHLSHRGSFIREGALVLLARVLRLKVFATIHGSQFVASATDRRWAVLYRFVLMRAYRVAVLNDQTRAALVRLSVTRPIVILNNPGPVPSSRASTPPSSCARRVVFGGLVGARKGVDVLLRAWPQVLARHPNAELALWGPIDPRTSSEFRALVEPHYRGVASREELWCALAACRLAVLPSRAEAMPMFIIEAMAHGRPVVGSRVGAVPKQIDGAGLTVDAGDTEALAAAINCLLSDDCMADAMGNRGKRRYEEQFGAVQTVRALVDFYSLEEA